MKQWEVWELFVQYWELYFLVLGFGFALWDEFFKKKRLILEKKVHNKVMVRLT